MHPKSKELFEYFFTATDEQDKTKCRLCGGTYKKPVSGYTNLINHLKSKHDGFETRFREAHESARLSSFQFVNKKASNMLRWMDGMGY